MKNVIYIIENRYSGDRLYTKSLNKAIEYGKFSMNDTEHSLWKMNIEYSDDKVKKIDMICAGKGLVTVTITRCEKL